MAHVAPNSISSPFNDSFRHLHTLCTAILHSIPSPLTNTVSSLTSVHTISTAPQPHTHEHYWQTLHFSNARTMTSTFYLRSTNNSKAAHENSTSNSTPINQSKLPSLAHDWPPCTKITYAHLISFTPPADTSALLTCTFVILVNLLSLTHSKPSSTTPTTRFSSDDHSRYS